MLPSRYIPSRWDPPGQLGALLPPPPVALIELQEFLNRLYTKFLVLVNNRKRSGNRRIETMLSQQIQLPFFFQRGNRQNRKPRVPQRQRF